MTARDLAHKAFWTDHPLSQLYAIANGTWHGDRFEPAQSWSIRQLIDFAEQLPATIVNRLSTQPGFGEPINRED